MNRRTLTLLCISMTIFDLLNSVHANTTRRSTNERAKHTNRHRKKITSNQLDHTPDDRKNLNTSRDIMENLMHNYIRSDPPMINRPTEVKLGIYVNSFYSVSEQTMDYAVNMYLRQSWKDPRLAYTQLSPRILKIRLGGDYFTGKKSVWLPDTFFRNEKKASIHRITVDNRLMRLTSDGQVWYVTKISATLSCPMMLQTYPMDVQVCPMMFESFGYTMDTMYFAWLDVPVDINPDVELPQFKLVDKLLYDCSQNYTSGAYPCQEIRFLLRREIGYFVIQVFIPSILTVILSWVSFWINVDGVPARVSIGLLTVLTTTTQSAGINAQLPRVSYIKAIDIWMIMCLVFVFAALLEYAFVNVAARNGVRIRTPVMRQANVVGRTIDCIKTEVEIRSGEQILKTHSKIYGCWKDNRGPQLYAVTIDAEGCKRRARYIDKVARKCFPLAFLIFNFIYWVSYSLIPSAAGHVDDSTL